MTHPLSILQHHTDLCSSQPAFKTASSSCKAWDKSRCSSRHDEDSICLVLSTIGVCFILCSNVERARRVNLSKSDISCVNTQSRTRGLIVQCVFYLILSKPWAVLNWENNKRTWEDVDCSPTGLHQDWIMKQHTSGTWNPKRESKATKWQVRCVNTMTTAIEGAR